MVAKNLLKYALAMPADDRLELARRLWDSLIEDPASLPLTDAERQELDRRYKDFLETPDEGSSWEEVEAYVRQRVCH